MSRMMRGLITGLVASALGNAHGDSFPLPKGSSRSYSDPDAAAKLQAERKARKEAAWRKRNGNDK